MSDWPSAVVRFPTFRKKGRIVRLGDVVAVVGTVVSVIGIPLAILLARRGRKRPSLRYVVDFERIVRSEDRFLDTEFLRTPSGRPVTQISRTTVALWNYQGDTVRGDDIVPHDKLRVQLESNDEALQVRLTGRSRAQNKLAALISENDKSSVSIDFDFLDSGDGGVIEIIHQGSSTPTVVGTVRGAELSGRSHASLAPDALKLMSRSAIRRIIQRVKGEPPYLATVLLIPLLGLILFTLLQAPSGPSVLVDRTHYNLDTLAGQLAFSQDVVNHQAGAGYSTFELVGWSFFAVATLLLIGMLFATLRTPVPRSIIGEIELVADEERLSARSGADVVVFDAGVDGLAAASVVEAATPGSASE